MYQLKELSDFVAEKTEDMRHDDLIVVLGDFNISSRKFNKVIMDQFRDKAMRDPGFTIFLDPNFDCVYEYKIMMKLLSKEGLFKVTDFKEGKRDDYGPPVTFGGVEIDEDGEPIPVETALSGKHDLMSEQSIDFILQFERTDMPEYEIRKSKEKEPEEKDLLGISSKSKTSKSDDNYNNKKFGIDPESLKVEKFMIEGKEFTTISDHFGLSVYLNYNNFL